MDRKALQDVIAKHERNHLIGSAGESLAAQAARDAGHLVSGEKVEG